MLLIPWPISCDPTDMIINFDNLKVNMCVIITNVIILTINYTCKFKIATQSITFTDNNYQ